MIILILLSRLSVCYEIFTRGLQYSEINIDLTVDSILWL